MMTKNVGAQRATARVISTGLASAVCVAAFLHLSGLRASAAEPGRPGTRTSTQKPDQRDTSEGLWQHPCILITADERAAVLRRIREKPNAAAAKALLKEQVDEAVKTHTADAGAVLGTIPPLGRDFYGHSQILSPAVDAAILWYVTDDKAYGQYAADILSHYTSRLAAKTPKTATVCGDSGNDRRGIFLKIALAYDFIQPFLVKPDTTVYDSRTKARVPFDNSAAQRALVNMVEYGVDLSGPPDSGRKPSNHAILDARGVLFPILCINDRQDRERLFEVFWETGTKAQPSLKNSVLPMLDGQGIWPESTSYGGVNPMGFFDVIDRYRPDLRIIESNTHILEGAFLRPQLSHPHGKYVRYGDSKRPGGLGAAPLVLYLAHKKGLKDIQRKAEELIKGFNPEQAGDAWVPGVGPTHDNFGYHPPFALLQDPIPFDPKVSGKFAYKRTVIIEHAGVALVRNWVGEDNVPYGLNGYIGGAHHVHSHCTGISMELYGAGYVMGPSPGMPSPKYRGEPVHVRYRRLYAGNNTVIVNGTSQGRQSGAWKSKSNVWQNNAVNVACEPKHMEEPVSEAFGFATQSLKDTVNDCRQQRTLSIIRTSPTTGYYLDIFRSRSNKENKFHDYVYHNLGDETRLTNDAGNALKLAPTDKYDNDIGDIVKSPGWRFFEDEQSSESLADCVRIRFRVDHDKRYMHVLVPGGVPREYTKALGPPTLEAQNGYDAKKTQILAIRQQGEAWDRPYVVVFEPSLKETPTVVAVRHLFSDDKLVGVEVKSMVDGAAVTDIILDLGKGDASVSLADRGIEFQGRFAVIRTESNGDGAGTMSLYIGEGRRLGFGKHQLLVDDTQRGFKVF